jgi:tetratricopeptide (TPR) repeat protein
MPSQHYYAASGEESQAVEAFERSLAIARRRQDKGEEARTLIELGTLHLEAGRLEEATDHYTEGLALFQEVGDQAGQAQALVNLGIVARRLGRYEEAVGRYEAGLAIYRAVGLPRETAQTLHNLVGAYLAMGDEEQARAIQAEAAVVLAILTGDKEGAIQNEIASKESAVTDTASSLMRQSS